MKDILFNFLYQYPRLYQFYKMENQKTETPQFQGGNNEHQKKNHNKGQKKQKKQFKSQYVFDADAIKIDTQIPPLPKKNELIPKPDIQKTKQQQKKIRQKITKLIDQKKQIRTQNFKPQKNNKKGQQNKHDTFRNELQQVKDLRDRLNQVKKQRNQKRDRLHKLIEQAKANNALLKELGGQSKGSRQNIQQKLESLQQRFTVASLSKEQQKNLVQQITELKRKIKDAQSVGNIEYKIAKAQQRKQQLDHEIEQLKQQKQPLEKQYTEIKQKLDKKNAAIDGLKKDLDTDKKQFLQQKQKNNKQWQKWKENKKKRLDDIEQRIKKLNEQNDKLWEDFNQSKQAYWKQKHYVDWIQWQMKVKNRKVNEVEREKKRLMYEEKQKQFEKKQKLQKYIGEIQLCNLLIQYLNNIKEDWNRSNDANKNVVKEEVDIGAKLAADSTWKKQKVQVIKSKKSQVQEEAPKKGGKKNKNRNQDKKQETKTFNIPYTVQNQFQSLKVLAPTSIQQVDKKIEQLRERERLFERGCQAEQVSQEDTKLLDDIKNKKGGRKQEQKKVQAEEQFPTI